MKLLKKTNRAYFIISAFAFIIAGVVFYIAISYYFEDQLNEQLESDRMTVIHNIEKDGTLPVFNPFVEVKKTFDNVDRPVTYSDTAIYDENENENVPFRQISSVDRINGQYYHILVRNTLLEKGDMMIIIGIIVGGIFILLYASLYFINKKLSLVIWKPFHDTLKNLRNFSNDNPDFKLTDPGNIDEFIELNRTLENLTLKVISDYLSLKRFTEDASHEMQSPLSVIQSKLETLIQYPDLKEDQAELIKSAYISVQRISKLTKALLLLTKIENEQFPEKKNVNLSGILLEKIKLFEDIILRKSLVVKEEIEKECYVETNLFLADSLLINLIGNAVKHCIPDGIVQIRLTCTFLEISNSGSPLLVPSSKLFDRFFKINQSSESPGLGLSIVKEICNHNKWIIEYFHEDNLHKFKVTF
jgi:signal transduction histidine kinase